MWFETLFLNLVLWLRTFCTFKREYVCYVCYLLFLLKNQEVQSINQGYQPLTPPSEATLRNWTWTDKSCCTQKTWAHLKSGPTLRSGHIFSHRNNKRHYSDVKPSLCTFFTHWIVHKHYLTQTDITVGTSFPTCLLKARAWLQFWTLFKRFSVKGHAVKNSL